MLEVKKCIAPSPEQWEIVIHGMRNAFKSWEKGDSDICKNSEEQKEICFMDCPHVVEWVGEEPYADLLCNYDTYENGPVFVLGKDDRDLTKRLISGDSPSHRKFLRQLPVAMDIKAPLYFWKQLDTYKVGTTANSESTMHCLVKDEFKPEDFSTDFINSVDPENNSWFRYSDFIGLVLEDSFIDLDEYFEYYNIGLLNSLRDRYLKTKEMNYWYLINELLPQSYNQTRTWTANYEVLLTITAQRIHHKLPEWRELITYWLKNIPYLQDFAVYAGIIKLKDSDVVINDKTEDLLYSLDI